MINKFGDMTKENLIDLEERCINAQNELGKCLYELSTFYQAKIKWGFVQPWEGVHGINIMITDAESGINVIKTCEEMRNRFVDRDEITYDDIFNDKEK